MKKIAKCVLIIALGIIGLTITPNTVNAAEVARIIDYTETTTEQTSTEPIENGISVQNGGSSSKDTQATENTTLDRIIESVNEGDAINSDGTIDKMDADDLFHKIHVKTFEGMTALQKEILIVVVVFFLIALVGIVWSVIFNKQKIITFIVAALITLIIFVCVYYAPDIMLKFKQWFIA